MTENKVKKVLVFIADGCEEIETVTIIDILRRSTTRVTVVGLDDHVVVGSRRIKIVPEESVANIQQEEFDAVVLPGGIMGVDKLRADQRVLDIVKAMFDRGAIVGAICAAPLILRDAGIIEGKRLTSYPNIQDKLKGCQYLEDDVVIDGNLITSRAPGTAMAFALALVKIFAGQERADEVARLALSEVTV